MYESNISTARWIAYDIPGNIGWISFLAGLILCFVKRPELLGDSAVFALLLLDVICGAAMLVGIAELIRERRQKLDRVLPKLCLYRGFGALTFGGLGGLAVSLLALAAAWAKGLAGLAYPAVLCGGSLLCFVFGGLLLKEYKRI